MQVCAKTLKKTDASEFLKKTDPSQVLKNPPRLSSWAFFAPVNRKNLIQ